MGYFDYCRAMQSGEQISFTTSELHGKPTSVCGRVIGIRPESGVKNIKHWLVSLSVQTDFGLKSVEFYAKA